MCLLAESSLHYFLLPLLSLILFTYPPNSSFSALCVMSLLCVQVRTPSTTSSLTPSADSQTTTMYDVRPFCFIHSFIPSLTHPFFITESVSTWCASRECLVHRADVNPFSNYEPILPALFVGIEVVLLTSTLLTCSPLYLTPF